MSLRFGQISIAFAVFNLLILGTLIAVRLYVPSDWMNTEDLQKLERTAFWVFIGNWSIALFPILSILGLILGVINYFQTTSTKFFALIGISFNLFLLFAWIIGIIVYQVVFHSDRFYVK